MHGTAPETGNALASRGATGFGDTEVGATLGILRPEIAQEFLTDLQLALTVYSERLAHGQ